MEIKQKLLSHLGYVFIFLVSLQSRLFCPLLHPYRAFTVKIKLHVTHHMVTITAASPPSLSSHTLRAAEKSAGWALSD